MKMIAAVLLCMVISAPAAHAEKISIAVLPFQSVERENAEQAKLFESAVEAILVDMKRFTIVERSSLETLLDEQKLSASGLIDMEIPMGFIKGVNYFVMGRLNSITWSKTMNQGPSGGYNYYSYQASASLFLKIVNIETAQAIFAKELSIAAGDDLFGMVKQKTRDDAMGQLNYKYKTQLRKIIAESFPIEGMIVGVEELRSRKKIISKALINLGEKDGMEKGLAVDIVMKKSIGDKIRATSVGSGKILFVEGDFSVISVDKGDLRPENVNQDQGSSDYYILIKTTGASVGGKTTTTGPKLF